LLNKLKINTLFNIAGNILPAVAAMVFLPLIMKNLGDESFAVFLLILIIVGTSGIFDFGIGRSITQKISSEKDIHLKAEIFISSLVGLLFISFIINILLFILFLLLRETSEIYAEMFRIFWLLSFSIVFSLLNVSTKSYLEGMHLFRDINIYKTLTGLTIFVFAYYITKQSNDIIYITLMILIVRILHFYLLLKNILKLESFSLKYKYFNISMLKELFSNGKWFAISNIIGPLTMYMDRFIISGLLAASIFNYYALSMEVAVKILIFPMSIMSVFFPILVTYYNERNFDSIRKTTKKMYLYIFFLIGLPLILLFNYSELFLTLWIDENFALNANHTFRIILLGVIVSSLTQVSFTLLQATKKAKSTGLVHLYTFIPYAILLFLMTKEYGLNGASYTWIGRSILVFIIFNIIYNFKKVKNENINIKSVN
jgi:O-antigen/teichoic acid export membrane protein